MLLLDLIRILVFRIYELFQCIEMQEFVEFVKKGVENSELRNKLTENADNIARRYSLENIGKKYLEIYSECSTK